MDLTTFSQDGFDPKTWINDVFKSEEAQDNRDKYASSLVMRLQLAIQQVNNSLEETSQQVVGSLPRVLRDVESLGHEGTVLKNQMNLVRQDIEKVEHSTAASMQSLVALDTLKERLAASSQALREADNWTTLSTDIEEVMDSGDFDAISTKLLSLQSCLSILTHVPDYEDRATHLEGLKVRLEALASPHIVSAFTHHNLDESMKYAKMLTALGRGSELESYYHKCEQGQLLARWRTAVEMHPLSGPPMWISTFYDSVATLVQKQIKWCPQVFKGSDSTLLLCELTQSTLKSLDPPVSQVISASIKQQEDPLTFLLDIKKIGDDFLRDLEAALGYTTIDKSQVTITQASVVTAVYDPLKPQLAKYKEFEEALLISHLISADIVKLDLSETLQRLRAYCTKISGQTEAAASRCMKLTQGWCFPGLVAAVASYIEEFAGRLSQAGHQVEQQKTSIMDDWTVFTTCLNLIHAAGELLMTVDNVEHSLATIFTNATSKFTWGETSSPFITTPTLLLHQSDIEKLKMLIKTIVDEDGRLFDGSLSVAQSECESSVDVALNTIMSPICCQLKVVHNLPIWNTRHSVTSSLSASFSPQEYITQVGQYLLTLPQHLEPLLVNPSPALNRALQQTNTSSGPGSRVVSESEISAADFLINSVGQTTSRLYAEAVLKINEISTNMITQLTTDIDYLCNILEDLGVTCCDPLDKLNVLLKAPADTYWKIAPGNNPRLVAAVRQMRDIPAQS